MIDCTTWNLWRRNCNGWKSKAALGQERSNRSMYETVVSLRRNRKHKKDNQTKTFDVHWILKSPHLGELHVTPQILIIDWILASLIRRYTSWGVNEDLNFGTLHSFVKLGFPLLQGDTKVMRHKHKQSISYSNRRSRSTTTPIETNSALNRSNCERRQPHFQTSVFQLHCAN